MEFLKYGRMEIRWKSVLCKHIFPLEISCADADGNLFPAHRNKFWHFLPSTAEIGVASLPPPPSAFATWVEKFFRTCRTRPASIRGARTRCRTFSASNAHGEREGKRGPNVFKICQFHLFAFHGPSDGFQSGRVRPLSQHYAKRLALGARPLPDNLNILRFSQLN